MFSSSSLVAEGVVAAVNVTFVIGVATEVVRTATVVERRVPVAAVVWIAIFMFTFATKFTKLPMLKFEVAHLLCFVRFG
jgi:hypothetical protein